MNMALQVAANYLREVKEVKIDVDEERSRIHVGFKTDNKDHVEVNVIFDDDGTTMGLRSFNFCKFAEDKRPAMYKTCSEMNKQFRWVKFFVDESDNTITLADDAVIQAESCGPEVWELICRMVGIADDAYPNFMKAIWS